MGFRLAPREVAPLPPQPVGPPFSSILGPVLPSPSCQVLKMMVNEFAFAISTLHFPTLGKCSKAISEVQANGATENTWPKEGCLFCRKMQYW